LALSSQLNYADFPGAGLQEAPKPTIAGLGTPCKTLPDR